MMDFGYVLLFAVWIALGGLFLWGLAQIGFFLCEKFRIFTLGFYGVNLVTEKIGLLLMAIGSLIFALDVFFAMSYFLFFYKP
ncbi:hypothetical protein [Ralstonia phage RSP15]|uniref:hypothetical protein n=1 Tax=Ralstonia phage RSP15 TaxID=1785960 RepID=UPI00074D3CA1|nr:hypothetical protein BH754_gp120 [Ralstonia phage RSP15]BAU40186.1 hypothetical protein [Ralstonia phage RSP15]